MTSILRLPDVLRRTGLSRSSIYSLIERGAFPQSVRLGARAVGWTDQSIDDWISARIAQRDAERVREAPMAQVAPTQSIVTTIGRPTSIRRLGMGRRAAI